jgi:hypothetical protein
MLEYEINRNKSGVSLISIDCHVTFDFMHNFMR